MVKYYSIGRDPSCNIVLYDPTQVVSRNHATLRVEGSKYFIMDHSTNGTYRNGIRLTPNVEYRITKDDDVSFGEVVSFDWSVIPGRRHQFNSFWLYLLSFLLVGLLIIGLLLLLSRYRNNSEEPTSAQQPPTVQVDSSVVADENDKSLEAVESVKEPKGKKAKKSTPKPSEPEAQPAPVVSKKAMDGYVDEDDINDVDPL